MLQVDHHVSWLREFLIPAFFTVLGAGLGFVVSQVREDRKAKLAKEAFCRAIGMELDALGDQLDASFHEVRGSIERFDRFKSVPNFAFSPRTSVFTTQVGKLRDVDDPLMIEVIHFYSDLGTLEHIFESSNDFASEFKRAGPQSDAIDEMGKAIDSTLSVLVEQIGIFGTRLRALRAKLPKR